MQETKTSKLRLIKLFLICVLISLLLTTTLAWVDSLLNAGLEGKNIQVGEVSGLALQFDGDYQADIISINDFLSDKTTDFYLSECSSVSGIDNFFVRDDSITSTTNSESLYFSTAVANEDYIEITFNMTNNNAYEAGVIFDNVGGFVDDNGDTMGTFISMQNGVSSDAIRVSLEVKDLTTVDDDTTMIDDTVSYIFGTYPETGSEGYTEENQLEIEDEVTGDITYFFNTLAVSSLKTDSSVDEFENTSVYGFDAFTEKNSLFTLEQNQMKQITVRIWLEGGSYACTNVGDADISGELFDLGIMFTSFEISVDEETTS